VIEFPAQTAALLSPYLDESGAPTDATGDLYVDGPTMATLVAALDAAGWQVHSHAIGDLAVRTALDAYGAAIEANGDSDRRHTIAHLQLVDPADYPRFAETGTIACMQLQWAVRNTFTLDALEPYIGEERFARLYPAASLEAAGAFVSGGSDWPVDPLNPFNQIESAIRRIGEYTEDPGPLGESEGLDRLDALAMHTRRSAFQLHLDDRGVLEPGRRADVIVLDRDITSGDVHGIRDARVRYTFVAGTLVYEADAAADGAGDSPVPPTTG
jgi:predicted amidohydrolase YtcJ